MAKPIPFPTPPIRAGSQVTPPQPTQRPSIPSTLLSLYATFGFAAILANGLRRVYPMAIAPFLDPAFKLTNTILLGYIVTIAYFLKAEGLDGFHNKFNPMLISRSYTLSFTKSPYLHILLAPLYAPGFIGATRKRMIVSWSISLGVSLIIVVTKKLPILYRSIIDAGVIFGLGAGLLSLIGMWVHVAVKGEGRAKGWTRDKLELVKPYL